MNDITALRSHLETYEASLSRHRGVIDDEFRELALSFRALMDVYQGTGAEEFATVFNATMQRMNVYGAESAALSQLLKDRMTFLRDADRPPSSA